MKINLKSCLKLALTAFLLFLCIKYFEPFLGLIKTILSAASPLLIGLAAAYIINILMSFFETHYFSKHAHKKFVKKSKTPVCMILAIATLLGIVTLIIGLVIPELVQCVKFLIAEIPPLVKAIVQSDVVTRLLPENILKTLAETDWQAYLSSISGVLVDGIGGAAGIIVSTLTSVFSGIVTAFLSIIFTIYILLDRDRLKAQCKALINSYIPEKAERKILYGFRVLNNSFRKYIVGQCTEAVILGLLCTAGMFIFRFPYAGMIGALIGFTALIPIAGAYIGAGVGALMILTQSPVKALLFIVFIVVLQQLEGNLIYPKVVGKSIGLPAIWVLAAVTVGGSLLGIMGMLIGVPVTASIYRLIKEDVEKRKASAENAEVPDTDVE